MGGHGGLNILPQKRWNVYNFENREKVRKDEEAAAHEEQLKREQSRRRDAEFRLEQLRRARALPAAAGPVFGSGSDSPSPPSDSRHINLFEGLEGFSSLTGSGPTTADGGEERRDLRRNPKREDSSSRDSKRKREERPAVISPEEEKYRMGYGVAGKGVKAPWYLSRPALAEDVDEGSGGRYPGRGSRGGTRKKEVGGKKTIEELRAERLKREKREKERERAVLMSAKRGR